MNIVEQIVELCEDKWDFQPISVSCEKILNIAELGKIKSSLSQINSKERDDCVLMLIQVGFNFAGPEIVLNTWKVNYVKI